MILTHWLQLGDEFFLGPLLLLAPEGDAAGDDELVVVGVGHVEVVHQHDVRILMGRRSDDGLRKALKEFDLSPSPEAASSTFGERWGGWRSGRSTRKCTEMT